MCVHIHTIIHNIYRIRKCHYSIILKLSRKGFQNTLFVIYLNYISRRIILRLINKNIRFFTDPINSMNFVTFLYFNFSDVKQMGYIFIMYIVYVHIYIECMELTIVWNISNLLLFKTKTKYGISHGVDIWFVLYSIRILCTFPFFQLRIFQKQFDICFLKTTLWGGGGTGYPLLFFRLL